MWPSFNPLQYGTIFAVTRIQLYDIIEHIRHRRTGQQ